MASAVSRRPDRAGPGTHADPETIVLTRERSIAFLTVIQRLTPQQRAALILRDVLGWSAKEAAGLLDVSIAAANSALQRARATRQRRLPHASPKAARRGSQGGRARALEEIGPCHRAADLVAFMSILRDDAVFRMPPEPDIVVGRDAMLRLCVEAGFGSERFGRVRCVLTRANLQPAVAYYVRRPGDTAWRALALDVLRIEEGLITEIVTFAGTVFPRFGLPLTIAL